MIISAHQRRLALHPPGQTPQSRAHIESESRDRIEQRLSHITTIAVAVVRVCIVLLAGMSLVWHIAPATRVGILLLALVLALITFSLGYTRQPPFWLALIGDGITLTLLLYATGGAQSPLLGLTLVLIVQGALLGDGRDALAGGGIGIAILLLLNLLESAGTGAMLIPLLAIHLIGGVGGAWLCEQARLIVDDLLDRAARLDRQQHDGVCAKRTIEWYKDNLQINDCDTIEALVRLAATRAAVIAGGGATIELAGAAWAAGLSPVSGRILQLPIAGVKGQLTIYRNPGELDQGQHDAIESLAAMVGLRAAQMRDATRMQRQQASLQALWEVAGMVRALPDIQRALAEACQRLASALDLDWLALFTFDDRQALAPVQIARGRSTGGAPRLSPAQVRVAAEAMRAERPLVRSEDGAVLACLPVRLDGYTPMVLAAHGDAADAASQTLLMILADLIADRVRAEAALAG